MTVALAIGCFYVGAAVCLYAALYFGSRPDPHQLDWLDNDDELPWAA